MRRVAPALLYLGILAIVIGLGRYHARFIGHYYFHSSQRLPWNITYGAFLCISAYGIGLPDIGRGRSAWGAAFLASAAGAAVISIVQILLGSLLLPRFVVVAAVALVAPWCALCARVADIGRGRGEERDRVVAVVGDQERAALEAEVRSGLERPAALAACLLPKDASATDGYHKPLIDAVAAHRGSVVVLDRVSSLDETIVEQAATLHESGLRVRSLSMFYDEWIGKLPISELERMSLMFDIGDLHQVRYGRLKRMFDILIGILGVGLLVLLLPILLVANVVGNRGPLFFRQERIGRGSRPFQLLKFRTMRPGVSSTEWTSECDPRVTRWGRMLRATHLDELPQVLNILRGHQSMVGPRPEQSHYVAELRAKVPFYDLRHLVRPGLTGWAQVKYGYGGSEMDAMEKLQYDFFYMRHQSVALDFRIIARTLRQVIARTGR